MLRPTTDGVADTDDLDSRIRGLIIQLEHQGPRAGPCLTNAKKGRMAGMK